MAQLSGGAGMSFEYHEPMSLPQAIDLLARYGDQARLLAGGTDLMVLVSRKKVRLQHVISLGCVPGLTGIRQDAQGDIVIGALNTHRELELSPLLSGPGVALRQACQTVGGVQVRNQGTIGGNLCNASPAADTVPVLLTMDARVTLQGPAGSRELPLDLFILGPRRTALGPAEILTAITVPRFVPRTASVFLKAGRRKAMEISLCAVAVRVTLLPDNSADVAIGLGAVAPRAFRPAGAEALLRGQTLTPELIRRAGSRAAEECSPISDVRGTAEFRRMLVEAMTERAIIRCLDQLRPCGADSQAS